MSRKTVYFHLMTSHLSQTVILTGSSGYVGSLVLEDLKRIGLTVIEIDAHNGAQSIDLSNENDVSKIVLPKNYILIHLAFPLPGSYKSSEFRKLIQKVNSNILRYFQPERALFISSTAIYPLANSKRNNVEPWEVYGDLKLESEKILGVGLDDLTIFRPGTLVEVVRKSSMMKFLSQMTNSRIPLIPGDGNLIHPFTHTHDLVKAIVDWTVNPNVTSGVYDLTALNPLTMNELNQQLRTKKMWFPIRLPICILSHIGSDRFPIMKISRWHFRALCYDYQQLEINTFQANFKSYKEIFTS